MSQAELPAAVAETLQVLRDNHRALAELLDELFQELEQREADLARREQRLRAKVEQSSREDRGSRELKRNDQKQPRRARTLAVDVADPVGENVIEELGNGAVEPVSPSSESQSAVDF